MTQEVEQTQENQAEQSQNQEVDYKAMYEEAQSKVSRLEKESKKYKTRFDDVQSTRSELEQLKQEKLEREGSLEDKVNHYKTKYDEVLGETRELKNSILTNKVKDVFRSVAPDCQKVDFVINNEAYTTKFAAAIDRDTLEIDSEIIKEVYETDKRDNPFLYGRRKIAESVGGSTEETSATRVNKNVSQEDYNKVMNPEERIALMKKKYGL